MDFTQIDAYLEKMHFANQYRKLEQPNKESIIFEATELLKDNFAEAKLTDRAIALQVLFMLEGEEEEYSKLKRHGVKSYAVKGVSVAFDGNNISPDVLAILQPKRASVGRLL
ncbi:hypothetical protein [Sutcliffiella horikoshii]|uniref:hypothetical protein n=1 Tax=Sutcliffiella horikoshii TaxID=79883 RepID=UPI003CF7CE16